MMVGYGAKGSHVKDIQKLLKSRGFFEGYIGGNFLSLTRAAVQQFQASHMGPDGKWLQADGIVGPKTMWALQNASGKAQRSGIKSGLFPHGLSSSRKKILSLCYEEHQAGTKEIPDGSNKGDGVDKFIKGIGPCPWCCYFVSWVYKNAVGNYPMGKRHGHCATMWNQAKKEGKAILKTQWRDVVPGDIFILLYGSSGSGHTGIVTNMDSNGNYNTIEGNAGNRVKHGRRSVSQGILVGFIQLLPSTKFQRQVVSASAVSSSLSDTR